MFPAGHFREIARRSAYGLPGHPQIQFKDHGMVSQDSKDTLIEKMQGCTFALHDCQIFPEL
jgi:hypothetical protein